MRHEGKNVIGMRTTIADLARAAALIGVLGLIGACPARAQSITANLTQSFQSGNTCSGCGPFGTVSVTTVTADEVMVTLTLAQGDLFSFGGAGHPLLFDISGNPTITSFSVVSEPTNAPPNGFTFSQAPPVIMADGTGTWNDAVSCASCPTGTGGNISGTLSFTLTASSAIAPSSFVTNANGLYFASDVGVPNGSGGFFTGDVGATAVSTVPEPATFSLIAVGLGTLGLIWRRRKARGPDRRLTG
jgi:hypothetical protein